MPSGKMLWRETYKKSMKENSEGKIIQNKEYCSRNYSNEKNNLTENNFEGGNTLRGNILERKFRCNIDTCNIIKIKTAVIIYKKRYKYVLKEKLGCTSTQSQR